MIPVKEWWRYAVLWTVAFSYTMAVILTAGFLAQKTSITVMTIAFHHGYVSKQQALTIAFATVVFCTLGGIFGFVAVDRAYLKILPRLQKLLRIQRSDSSNDSADHDKSSVQGAK
jgi:hypothetical protein